VQVGSREQRVVVEHLLEVRHGPARVDAVAREAAADLVEDAAPGHRAEGLQCHRELVARQEELDDRRLRELRWAAPAAVDAVEALAQDGDRIVERGAFERLRGRPQQRAAGQPRGHALALRADLLALGVPRLGHGAQHLSPARHAHARFGGK
jgi:hypothetical protein